MRSLVPTNDVLDHTPLRLTTMPTCLDISFDISIMFLALSKEMTVSGSACFR
jgi:hypothetical protein